MKVTAKDRRSIKRARWLIRETIYNGAPDNVFAQARDGGQWEAVRELQIIGGIIWVRPYGGSRFMAFDVKIAEDLPEPGVDAS